MKSSYHIELKEFRVETHKMSHILQFALVASLVRAKASPSRNSVSQSCCHGMAAGRSSWLLPCLCSPPLLT